MLQGLFFAITSIIGFGIIHGVLARTSSSSYNWSPDSRIVWPTTVFSSVGNITNIGPTLGLRDVSNSYAFESNASITYDFGQMTAGIIAITAGPASSNTTVQVSFTESYLFIGNSSDQSVFTSHTDGPLPITIKAGEISRPDSAFNRGSFRYVTISGPRGVTIDGISVEFSPMPRISSSRLREYSGFFDSSDDLLNRIWYAGAYTNQLCLISANSSVDHNFLAKPTGWANNASVKSLLPDATFLADGAKRDRNPWAGDLSVAVPSMAASQNHDNLQSVRNSLIGMLVLQNNRTGYFPYAGSPLGDVFLSSVASDTYHLWTMYGFADYVIRSQDFEFALQHAAQIVRGLEAIHGQIDPITGLFNGSNAADWGRNYLIGETSSANAILYGTLSLITEMAQRITIPQLNTTYMEPWAKRRAGIKAGMNTYLWNESIGMFFDNTTLAGRNLFPQDGNSFAIEYNLTISQTQAQRVASNLASRLGVYGAPAPEFIGGIAPFVGSHELTAHFTANPLNVTNAMLLLKRQWGYMLGFSASTLIEGYSTDGSLNYPFYANPSFISHAHAWSTGPTATLINKVLGINAATAISGWLFAPHYLGSGLTHCSGSYTANNASYSAEWRFNSNFSAMLNITGDRAGTIRLPLSNVQVSVNGSTISANYTDGQFLVYEEVYPGTIEIRPLI